MNKSIDNPVLVDTWISIKIGMPQEGVDVLLFDANGKRKVIGSYNGERFIIPADLAGLDHLLDEDIIAVYFMRLDITHWKDLGADPL